MSRFRVLAGPSVEELEPITGIVNTGGVHPIQSDAFDGQVVVHIKGLEGAGGDDGYFEQEDRKNVTWSIQVQGRFLQSYYADDVLFGNIFERPLKLPYGSFAVFKFMNYMDPTLEHDLGSNAHPWALSPLISTMPYFAHARLDSRSSSPLSIDDVDDVGDVPEMPAFPPKTPLADDLSQLQSALVSPTPSPSSSNTSLVSTGSAENKSVPSNRSLSKKKGRRTQINELHTAAQRRAYFASAENRRKVCFGPDDVLTVDFCYGFLNFSPRLSLSLPGGLSFDLMRYWDGQPVQFVCCERRKADEKSSKPWGRIFWCVAIELEEEA